MKVSVRVRKLRKVLVRVRKVPVKIRIRLR